MKKFLFCLLLTSIFVAMLTPAMAFDESDTFVDVSRKDLSSLDVSRNTDLTVLDYDEYKQQQFDILADAVRRNLDMELIYRILDQKL